MVGRRGGVAEPLVTAAGLRLETLAVSGLDLADPRTVIRAAWRLPAATFAARGLLRRTKADAVIGAGGYVCVPVVAAAWLLGLPVVLMEQNAVPGRATRLLARRSRVVATSFAETAQHLRAARTVMTGNPVRREIRDLAPAPQRDRCAHVLVMGGSQGARTLNRAIGGSVRDILSDHGDLHITHQCGALDAEAMRAVAASLPAQLAPRYTVAPFFTDMAQRIAASDLVLMRAGGSSLAECTALGRAMILVPYPYAGGHQAHNVRPHVDAGAAIHIADSQCTPERVRSELNSLINDEDRFRTMSRASAAMGRPHAAEEVAMLVAEAVGAHTA